MKQLATMLLVVGFIVANTGASTVAADPTAFGVSHLEEGQQNQTVLLLDNPCTFTENENPDKVESGAGIACVGMGATTDNQFLRIFDLDGDFSFGGEVCVDSLDYAVEQSLGNVDVTFNVYCVTPGIEDDFIVERDILDPGLVFSVEISQPDATLEFFNQPLGGCCDADTQDLVIEIATEDCLENGTCIVYFPGGNFDFLDPPWYIGAPDCGIDDPVDADLITGLGAPPLVMFVNGTCEVVDDDVPATTGIGTALLLTLLAGGGALLRRRKTTA